MSQVPLTLVLLVLGPAVLVAALMIVIAVVIRRTRVGKPSQLTWSDGRFRRECDG